MSVGGCVIYLEAPVIYENQTVFKGIFWVIFPLMFMGFTTSILSITTDNNFDLLLSLLKKKEAFVPQGLKEEAHILLKHLINYELFSCNVCYLGFTFFEVYFRVDELHMSSFTTKDKTFFRFTKK